MSSKLQIARETWGTALPDWVAALAVCCDRTSQNRAALESKVSASAISNICRNNYPHDTTDIEQKVRGTLMRETVGCKSRGEIGKHICLKWRQRATEDLDPINSQYVQMHRSCKRCPIFKAHHHED